jgi:enamine deaminase RidA (YjgF/YER057c/UK114 family)
MTIERFYGSAKGRCHVNRHAGLIYAVATAPGANFAEQMRNTLEALENNMKTGGSDKTRIIQATVYLNDMNDKAEMDEIWCDWIGPKENWPQRACVGSDLAGDVKVEIVTVCAAADSDG